MRHGDARTRSAAVTAPSGGLLSVEAVGRVATQQLLHVSIILCFQSSRSQTPVRFFYLVKRIIFYQLSTCARYPTHRECPRYKLVTTCQQSQDGIIMIHFNMSSNIYNRIQSTTMRYKHINKLYFVINMYQLNMNGHGIALHTFFKRHLNSIHK